ncbi:hypothetical protein V6Z11_D10G146200 [Gossypium hirsutum]
MTRIKRGYIARRHRTKISLFEFWLRLIGIDIRKKRFLSFVDHSNKCSNSQCGGYSRLIHNLYKKQLLLNRKILAQIAISNRNCIYMISNEIRKHGDRKESNEML